LIIPPLNLRLLLVRKLPHPLLIMLKC
jgi:hypothetical protein